jgi:hypothetical protein
MKPAKRQNRQHPTFVAQLLTRKTQAQSEPDIISAVAARGAKVGIAANGLTQRNG